MSNLILLSKKHINLTLALDVH